eukprot:9365225-Lingulodinium_polyedra.AAC.1
MCSLALLAFLEKQATTKPTQAILHVPYLPQQAAALDVNLSLVELHSLALTYRQVPVVHLLLELCQPLLLAARAVLDEDALLAPEAHLVSELCHPLRLAARAVLDEAPVLLKVQLPRCSCQLHHFSTHWRVEAQPAAIHMQQPQALLAMGQGCHAWQSQKG